MMQVTEGGLLGGKIRYRQLRVGHRSGFEPVLLAATIPARPGERVLEVGTGAGAALLCLGARVAELTSIGVEFDPELAALANNNFAINGLADFHAVRADAAALPFTSCFDHVFANPPWHDASGTASPDARRALAHQAGAGLLERWIGAMATAMKPAGSLSLVLPAAACPRATAALVARDLAAISLFPLWPRAGQPAKQAILQAGRRGASRLLPGLVLHDEAGISPAAEAVLRHGAALLL